ncbi:MAG: squalene/phytoene synthase family protein, partial [Anaerolineales bacterium]|nr:squalene/phytoene synthase family protein [Anaerolineales bacterium]
PSQRGCGSDTPSQTAWALTGLMAAGRANTDAVRAGLHYLLITQQADGAWPEPPYTGTGFPRVFYLRYDLYRVYFPLLALARCQALTSRSGDAIQNRDPQLSLVISSTAQDNQPLRQKALEVLEETSRTFYIPISRLPSGLLEAVGSAYLCLRSIDEIEDHPELDAQTKVLLLRDISRVLQSAVEGLNSQDFLVKSVDYRERLPEVTVRLSDWAQLAPPGIAARIWDATATMADRMADWAACGFLVHNQADLERYTFGVAGAVGLLLSELWAWYDGTQTDRTLAIGFGRGLQAVNILRNRAEDLLRGVDFYPDGWDEAAMTAYARRNLGYADAYTAALPAGPARDFCKIPLVLAHATLEALEQGRSKLDRREVMVLVAGAAKA